MSYSLVQNLLENFLLTHFIIRFLPTHGEFFVTTQVSILRPGYIMEGWKIYIRLTKLPKYFCNNKKYLAFYTYPGYFISLKKISHGECWKYHFWARLDFKFFWERIPPDPPHTNSCLPRVWKPPPPPHFNRGSAGPAFGSHFVHANLWRA